MRKSIILFLLLLISQSGLSQEKYLKDAISNGRQQREMYEILNRKSKYIKLDKLKDACQSRNYIIGYYSIKEMGRFGDVAETVDRFCFIPRNEYGSYIFENISGTKPFSALKTRGAVYFFEKNQSDGSFFKRYTDVMWTGETKNGLINGTGEGFKQLSQNRFIFFAGTFINGIPSGKTRYCIYNVNQGKYPFNRKFNQEIECVTGNLSEDLCWFKDSYNYGYINQNGQTVIKPIFTSAKDFSNGIAYVTEGKTEVKINKTGKVIGVSEYAKLSFSEMVTMKEKHPDLTGSIEVLAAKYIESGISFRELDNVEKEFPNLKDKILPLKTALYRKDVAKLDDYYRKATTNLDGSFYGEKDIKAFIDLYSSFHFDPDGKLKQAKDIDDYHAVCRASNTYVPSGSLWKDRDFPLKPLFDDDCYNDLSTLSLGSSIANNGSQSAFSNYYDRVKVRIKSKYETLSNKINQDRNKYNAALRVYEAKEKRKWQIIDNINSSNIYNYVLKEKDWSRGRIFDSDDDFTDSREVSFKDLDYLDKSYGDFSETIYEIYNRDAGIHYFDVSTGLFSSASYTTYVDCLVAAFLKRYGRSWNKNKR